MNFSAGQNTKQLVKPCAPVTWSQEGNRNYAGWRVLDVPIARAFLVDGQTKNDREGAAKQTALLRAYKLWLQSTACGQRLCKVLQANDAG